MSGDPGRGSGDAARSVCARCGAALRRGHSGTRCDPCSRRPDTAERLRQAGFFTWEPVRRALAAYDFGYLFRAVRRPGSATAAAGGRRIRTGLCPRPRDQSPWARWSARPRRRPRHRRPHRAPRRPGDHRARLPRAYDGLRTLDQVFAPHTTVRYQRSPRGDPDGAGGRVKRLVPASRPVSRHMTMDAGHRR